MERENVGTESAHKTELAAEGVIRGTSRCIKQRIRTAPARRVRKASKRSAKAKANHAYRKLVHDNPELKKKTLARLYHKKRLQMRYAKQARQTAKGMGKGVQHGGSLISKAAAAVNKIGVALIKKNPKV